MSATKLYVLFKTNNWSEGNRLLGKQKRTKINCHQNFVLLHVTHIILMKLITLKLVRKTMVSRLDSSFPTCSFVSEVKDIFRSFFFSLEFFLHKSSCSIFFFDNSVLLNALGIFLSLFSCLPSRSFSSVKFKTFPFRLWSTKRAELTLLLCSVLYTYGAFQFSWQRRLNAPLNDSASSVTGVLCKPWLTLRTRGAWSINQSKPKVTRDVTARENKTRAASAAK